MVCWGRSPAEAKPAAVAESALGDLGEGPGALRRRPADFYGIQALAFRCVVEAGEVLIRKRIDPSAEFPLKLQVLEPDFIDDTRDDRLIADGGYIREGIEYNSRDQRIAYHLHRTHPGDRSMSGQLGNRAGSC